MQRVFAVLCACAAEGHGHESSSTSQKRDPPDFYGHEQMICKPKHASVRVDVEGVRVGFRLRVSNMGAFDPLCDCLFGWVANIIYPSIYIWVDWPVGTEIHGIK